MVPVNYFRQARDFTRTNGRTIDLVVIHYAVTGESPGVARAIADYFAHPTYVSSAHYCVDAHEVSQSVLEKDVAYHAPGGNHDGIGIEHAGTEQTAAQWDDTYSKAMLELSARKVTADICRRYAIPAKWLTVAELRAGKRGICGHVDISNAFHRTDHTDPGRGFPQDRYVKAVAAVLAGEAPPDPNKTFEPLLVGATGWRVKRLQVLLNALPYVKLDPDGDFGKLTEKAVKQFQRRAGIPTTGRVGEKTWKALLKAQADRPSPTAKEHGIVLPS